MTEVASILDKNRSKLIFKSIVETKWKFRNLFKTFAPILEIYISIDRNVDYDNH